MELQISWGWDSGLGHQLLTFYQDLHRNPELSLEEHRTAERITEAIAPLGLEVTTGVGGTGVVAVSSNGEGPTVMLRADIDALPVEEKTGLPYASTARGIDPDGNDVPVMHACGHDMHATCLVGAMTVLDELKTRWSGTVVAVFQPAEELGRGASDMIADKLFSRFPRPEIVLGQHVVPLPAGTLGYGLGPMMAAADFVRIRIHGRGGHGSRPESTIDPIVLAASIVLRLQTIVSREVSPRDKAVVTVGSLHAGTKENIIPDEATLGITIRTYSEEVRTRVRASLERIVRAEAAASGAEREPDIDWTLSLPLLESDPDATSSTVAAFTSHFGADRIMELPPLAASEDVGHFGRELGVPTVFWFWGGSDPVRVRAAMAAGRLEQDVPFNHSPEFTLIPEPTITTGVEALVTSALTWLET